MYIYICIFIYTPPKLVVSPAASVASNLKHTHTQLMANTPQTKLSINLNSRISPPN